MRSFAILAVSGAVALAETTLMADIFLPGYDVQSLAASIIGVKDQVTTYSLECTSDDDTECGLLYGPTVTQGPSTWHVSTVFENESEKYTVTRDLNCNINRSKDVAICTVKVNENDAQATTSSQSSDTQSVTGLSEYFTQIPVTAGADKTASSETKSTKTAESSRTTGGSSADDTTATNSGDQASQTADSDDEEDAAVALKISALGVVAVIGAMAMSL